MGKHKARGISGAAAVAPAALASAAAPMEADAAAGPSTAAAEASTGAAAPGADGHTSADYYFDSYAHFGALCALARGRRRSVQRCRQRAERGWRAGIHEEMLKDNVRTKTYQQAICNVRRRLRARLPPRRLRAHSLRHGCALARHAAAPAAPPASLALCIACRTVD